MVESKPACRSGVILDHEPGSQSLLAAKFLMSPIRARVGGGVARLQTRPRPRLRHGRGTVRKRCCRRTLPGRCDWLPLGFYDPIKHLRPATTATAQAPARGTWVPPSHNIRKSIHSAAIGEPPGSDRVELGLAPSARRNTKPAPPVTAPRLWLLTRPRSTCHIKT